MKALPFAAALLIATGAAAQTTYSFAGLQWGMNVATVLAKLKSSGIHPSPYPVYLNHLCRVPSENCWLEFDDGPTNLAAPPAYRSDEEIRKDSNSFAAYTAKEAYRRHATVNGSAWFKSGALVEVTIDTDSRYADRREQKLRQNYGSPASVVEGECLFLPGMCRVLTWRSPSGETIEFDASGRIVYQSGALEGILNSEAAREKAAEEERVNRVRF